MSDAGVTVPETADEIAARTRIGRFEIESLLGAGGMGVVYAARDPVLDRLVAVKLLRADTGGTDSEARLLREAQAMARLAHPNVVTVHEAGVAGGAVYLAMELIDGATLKDWVATPRPWREVVDMYVAAGRGLAAAHASGMVHRDFKPANVLVDRAGKPKVADFGLVGVSGDAELTTTGPRSEKSVLVTPLTQSGAVMGTPAYMAPEQVVGADVDARADQYAFCKSLQEALTAHATQPMPRRLEPILARGLAIEPEARYPTLAPLLAALERAARRPRRTAVAAIALGGGALAVIAILIGVLGGDRDDPCGGVARRIDSVWDAARRDAARANLAALDPAQGAARFAVAAATLDRYSRDLGAMQRAACHANRVEHTESDTLYDARTRCLDRRVAALAAVAGGFAGATDVAGIDRAIGGLALLTGLEPCADREGLLAVMPPPDDPARRREVEAIERESDAIEDLRLGGDSAAAPARAKANLERARATDHLPAIAGALQVQIKILFDRDAEGALPLLRELTEVAAEAHDDRLAAWAWSKLLSVLSEGLEAEQAVALLPAARAALLRAPHDPVLRTLVLEAEAITLAGVQRLDEAQARLGEAMIVIAAQGAGLPGSIYTVRLAELAYTAGTLFARAGDMERAEPRLRQAIALQLAALGPDHPSTALSYQTLGEVLRNEGKADEALEALHETLRILELRIGPSAMVAATLEAITNALVVADRNAEAAPVIERAVAMFRTAGAKNYLAGALMTLAMVRDNLDDQPGALRAAGEAIEVFEHSGQLDLNLPKVLFNRGEMLERASRYDEAVADYRRSLDGFTRLEGADHPDVLYPLAAIGRALVKSRHAADALPFLDRAIALEATAGEPVLIAQARFYRGLALYASNKDRAGGTSAARAALADFAQLGDDATGELAEATSWWAHRAELK